MLLAELKLPQIDQFVAAVDKWLDSVKQFDAFTVMDLAYIELKMACWAGPRPRRHGNDRHAGLAVFQPQMFFGYDVGAATGSP